LFCAVLDQFRANPADKQPPRLVAEWNALEGWTTAERPVEISEHDATELLEALGGLTPADVAPYCAGCTPVESLRCASVIVQFLKDRLARGEQVFIEAD
jgi:hypothetical protein